MTPPSHQSHPGSTTSHARPSHPAAAVYIHVLYTYLPTEGRVYQEPVPRCRLSLPDLPQGYNQVCQVGRQESSKRDNPFCDTGTADLASRHLDLGRALHSLVVRRELEYLPTVP